MLTQTQARKALFKVQKPDTYDGFKSELRRFAAQITLYIRFNYNGLRTEKNKVFLVYIFLRGKAFD